LPVLVVRHGIARQRKNRKVAHVGTFIAALKGSNKGQRLGFAVPHCQRHRCNFGCNRGIGCRTAAFVRSISFYRSYFFHVFAPTKRWRRTSFHCVNATACCGFRKIGAHFATSLMAQSL